MVSTIGGWRGEWRGADGAERLFVASRAFVMCKEDGQQKDAMVTSDLVKFLVGTI